MAPRRGSRVGLIIIVLIILVLVVVVGVIALGSIFNGSNTPASNGNPTQEAPTPVPQTQIIVAQHDIRRGARLTQDDVQAADWPDSMIPPNAYTVGSTPDQPGLEQIDGKIARVDILANQPVLSNMVADEKDLSLQATGSDAALMIPSGQVAVAFPLNRMMGVAYALRTGDHIDVLMSFRFVDVDKQFQSLLPNNVGAATAFPSSSQGSQPPPLTIAGREENGPFSTKIMVVPSEPQRPRQVTQMVIKNAIVLHLGDWPLTDTLESIVVTPAPTAAATAGATPAPQGASPTELPPAPPDIITLIMSRQDALVLKYSLETGASIDFALRSALDNDVTDVSTDSVTLQYLMDFYDITEPPALPIAQEPRIDKLSNPDGTFQNVPGGSAPAATAPPS